MIFPLFQVLVPSLSYSAPSPNLLSRLLLSDLPSCPLPCGGSEVSQNVFLTFKKPNPSNAAPLISLSTLSISFWLFLSSPTTSRFFCKSGWFAILSRNIMSACSFPINNPVFFLSFLSFPLCLWLSSFQGFQLVL